MPQKHEKRQATALNVANLVSVSRLVLLPFFLLAVIYHRPGTALLILVLAGITDLLDGQIARRLNLQTTFGEHLDPVADKLLAAVGFIVLTVELGYANKFPIWLTTLILARDTLILVGAGCMYMVSGQFRFPSTMLGRIHSTAIVVTLGFYLLYNALGITGFWITFSTWFTLCTTLCSGIHYAYISIHPVPPEESND